MDRTRLILGLVALAAAFVLPYFAGPFWTGLVTQMYVFGLLALSVDLLLGHTGLFSLTHASFFAVSAYTVAITPRSRLRESGSGTFLRTAQDVVVWSTNRNDQKSAAIDSRGRSRGMRDRE